MPTPVAGRGHDQGAKTRLIWGTEATDLLKTKESVRERTQIRTDFPFVGQSCHFRPRGPTDYGIGLGSRRSDFGAISFVAGIGATVSSPVLAFGGRPMSQNRIKPNRVKSIVIR